MWTRDRLWAGLALTRLEPSGSGGAGQWLDEELLAGSVSSGWLLGPSQVLRLFSGLRSCSVLTCPLLALHRGQPQPPRLQAPLLSSGMTQDGTVLGGRQERDTHFSFGPCHTSVTTHPLWVLGLYQPCAFCPAWRPVCIRMCSDSPAFLQVWPAWQGLTCVWTRHVCGQVCRGARPGCGGGGG